MNPSQIPEKPLRAGINSDSDKNTKNKKVYFFERENGKIFHTDARDAFAILKGRKQIIGQFPERIKLIGVSNGETFNKAVDEAKLIYQTEGLQASQERIRKGVDEELAVARGHIEMPPNLDNVDLQGNAFDIRNFR